MRTNQLKKVNETTKSNKKYEKHKYIYDFQQFYAMIFFSDNLHTGKVNVDEAERN